jgi:hypothetical protein
MIMHDSASSMSHMALSHMPSLYALPMLMVITIDKDAGKGTWRIKKGQNRNRVERTNQPETRDGHKVATG